MSDSNSPTSRDQFSLLSPFVAPRTATEEKLAEIWRSALGIDRIGVEDLYEDLGGSSLLAASIFAEIEKVFAVTIDMNEIVDSPTVEQLARRVDELQSRAKG